MKLVKAIVRPNKVDEVRDALEKLNVGGMTVTEVRGHGRQKGHTAIYRGKEYNVTLLPKVAIDVVVTNNVVEEVIQADHRARRGPARSATAGCSCFRSSTATTSARVSRTRAEEPDRPRGEATGRGSIIRSHRMRTGHRLIRGLLRALTDIWGRGPARRRRTGHCRGTAAPRPSTRPTRPGC